MNATPSLVHPSADDLTRFALGQLDDADEGAVALHLDDCQTCQQHVASVPADGFVTLLRSARLADDTQVEIQAAFTLTDEPIVCRDEAPPALISHPRYRPIRLLGQGGMGSVWLAEHRLMGRHVAVKVIHPEFLRKPGAVARFRQEMLAASRLHHPNIVTAFDAEEAGDTHLLAMEHVEGVTLADELRLVGRLPIHEACDAVRQAALGLAHAAERGLVHRDLKPHNLMRTPEGVVKILDFGLAALVDPEANAGGLTGANIVLGTPDYIAPEQAEGSRNADVRSDIYSLGCTLYHLLTGRVPYPGESVLKKLDGHRGGVAEPLLRLRPEVPRGLAVVVAKMMEKDPKRRYQAAEEVAVALAPFCREMPSRTPPRRSPRVLVGAVLLAGLLLAAGVVIRVQTDEGEVVITTHVPDVEVVLLKNGKEVRIVDTKTTTTVTLPVGDYDVAVKGKPEGIELKTDRVEVRRGRQTLVTIERAKTAGSAAPVRKPPPEQGIAKNFKKEQDMNALRDDMVAAQIAARTLKDRNTQLEEQLQNAARSLVQLRSQGASGGQARGDNPPPEQVEGLVRRIDGRNVMISLGSDAGLSKGQTLQVFRLGQGFGYVGRIKIVDVEAKQAVGEVMGRLAKPIQVGDRVATQIAGGEDQVGKDLKGQEPSAGSAEVKYPKPTEVWRSKIDNGSIMDVAFVPDHNWIVAHGPTTRIHLLNPGSGHRDARIKSNPEDKSATILSSAGKHAIQAIENRHIRVLSLTTLFLTVRPLDGVKHVAGFDVSPDGRFVAGGGEKGGWTLWDLATGKELHHFDGNQTDAVAFSNDSKRVLAGGLSGGFHVWDLETKKLLSTNGVPRDMRDEHRSYRRRLAFSADGKFAYTTSNSVYRPEMRYSQDAISVREWNIATGKFVQGFGTKTIVEAFSVSRDGRRLVVANAGSPALIQGWNLTAPGGFASFSLPTWVRSLALNADGSSLLVGDDDGYVALYRFPAEPREGKMEDKPRRP